MKRDIYKAIMIAAAKDKGLCLNPDEIFALSMDDAISTRAHNTLTEAELPMQWADIDPRPQGEATNYHADSFRITKVPKP